MESPRSIAHFDLDAFYCSVEILRNPELAEKPLVVGGRPEQRGVVAAASYKAREYGIYSAMSMFRARQMCPNLVILPLRRSLYQMYSRIVMGILKSTVPVIEQTSIDEAYLDFTAAVNNWHDVRPQVKALQTKIKRDIGLPNSVGLATNKMIAKIASDFNKPNGFTVVEPGEEAAFIAPLEVRKIPGIGPKMTERLASQGIHLVAELARAPTGDLVKKFGKWGLEMAHWAKGLDDRPVVAEHEAKSISQERTFSQDIRDPEELDVILEQLTKKVVRQLTREQIQTQTIQIKIRWPDFTTQTRQLTLSEPTVDHQIILQAVRVLLARVWMPGNPVRLIGVGCSNFSLGTGQLTLPGLK